MRSGRSFGHRFKPPSQLQSLHQYPSSYVAQGRNSPVLAFYTQQAKENQGVARFQKVPEDSHSLFQQIFTTHNNNKLPFSIVSIVGISFIWFNRHTTITRWVFLFLFLGWDNRLRFWERAVQGNSWSGRAEIWIQVCLPTEPGPWSPSCTAFFMHAPCAGFCKRDFPWSRRKNPSLWFQVNHPLPWNIRQNRPHLLLLQQLSPQVMEYPGPQVMCMWSIQRTFVEQLLCARSWGHRGENNFTPSSKSLQSRAGVPNLQDLMADDLRWSWCNSNRNKVHNTWTALESSWNPLLTLTLVPKRLETTDLQTWAAVTMDETNQDWLG